MKTEISTSRSGVYLKLGNLNKDYDNLSVLKNINLDVAPGEFIAIVGRSGCGKSTLLRAIAGLEKPTRGEVLIDGKPLQNIYPEARVMFQDGKLLPWKRVLENVGLGLRGNWQNKATWALEQVGLADRSKEWISKLSGGQKQRVALARALASDPRLLVLDEPLSALDALTRIEMQSLIERLWHQQKFTALLVTHDVEEAVTLADRIILLEAGCITLNLPVKLARPRPRGKIEFVEYVDKILGRLIPDYHSNTL
jgi:sulfonate transport system ATP-binding protein